MVATPDMVIVWGSNLCFVSSVYVLIVQGTIDTKDLIISTHSEYQKIHNREKSGAA